MREWKEEEKFQEGREILKGYIPALRVSSVKLISETNVMLFMCQANLTIERKSSHVSS